MFVVADSQLENLGSVISTPSGILEVFERAQKRELATLLWTNDTYKRSKWGFSARGDAPLASEMESGPARIKYRFWCKTAEVHMAERYKIGVALNTGLFGEGHKRGYRWSLMQFLKTSTGFSWGGPTV